MREAPRDYAAPRDSMKASVQIWTAFILALIIPATIVLVAYRNTLSLVEAVRDVGQSNAVINKVQELLIVLSEAESRQRGFIITGKDVYLEPYKTSVSQVRQVMSELHAAVADSSEQARRLDALEPVLSARLEELQITVEFRQEAGLEAAQKIVLDDRGRALMDDIRHRLDVIREAELRSLSRSQQRAAYSARLTTRVMLYGFMLAIVLAALEGFLIHRVLAALGKTHANIAAACESLGTVTHDLLDSTTQQASGLRDQATAVAETAAAVDQVMVVAEQSSEQARSVAQASERALQVGESGRGAAENSVAVMQQAREQLLAANSSVQALMGRAEEIAAILTTLDDMAGQTNILALNSSTEASRSHEPGQGFAVVAEEIRSLADLSRKANTRIRRALSDVRDAMQDVAAQTHNSLDRVDSAIATASQAGETIRQVAQTLAQSAQAASAIAASASQQSGGVSRIQQAMKAIDAVMKQAVNLIPRTEQSARNLETLADRLQDLLTEQGLTGNA
jgi:methyl-accepting chemotaxis protein